MNGVRAVMGCVLALPALLPAAAFAQASAGAPQILPEVVTSATRTARDAFDLPVAIDSVEQSAIREDRPQVNLSEPLVRVPGVSVLNRQNYAQDLQISSRGFGARSTFGVRGIRLIADGIPATMPDGQAQAASFDLNSAQRIEVLRGPFSSLYGNASGGVIQLFTADGPPQPTVSGSAFMGSYSTYKGDAQFGGQTNDFNYMIDTSYFYSEGYRDHSKVRRDLTNAKFTMPLSAGTLTVVVNAFDQPDTQDPLGLASRQLAANPRQADNSAILFNTRKSVRQNQAGVLYDLDVGTNDQLHARAYGGDRQVTQYLALQGSTTNGGVVDLDRGYEGAGLRWTHRAGEARPLTLTTGVDYDRMAEHRKGFVNNFGVAGALRRDEQDNVINTGLYSQAEWRFAERWSASGGLRYSNVRFGSTDYYVTPTNPNDSGGVRFSKSTPVAGIVFNASPSWNLYGNIGRGFETPTFAELAYRPGSAPGLNFALQPSTSLSREVGVKGRIGGRARVNLAVFDANTNNEIVVDSSVGGRTTYKNAPQTSRKGVELSADALLGAGFEAALAYTWLDAQFSLPFTTFSTNCLSPTATTVTVPSGNRLPGVPGYNIFGELVWRDAPLGFHAGVEVRASGKLYVNDLNCASTNAYTIANLRAGFEQRGRNWRLTEFARLDNVTDRQYVGSVIVADGNNRFYEASPTRNWLLGVSASLSF